MVHSRPVLIFVALGAASIAAAAPLRLAPNVEPASQEAASCAHFDRDTPESVNPHDCSEIELNVSSGEHYVLDMGSFSSRCDPSGINLLLPFGSPLSQDDDTSVLSIESRAPHPYGPFHSPSSQERADADDTASVPGIASRALHPSGPFVSASSQERADADDTASVPGIASRALHPSGQLESFRRSFGVLSSRTSHAPDAHPLLRNRAETDIAGADDPDPPATLRISVPLQPISVFSTSSPSEAASAHHSLDHEVIATPSIASHVHDSSSPVHSSATSIDHVFDPNIDIASAHTIESRSPNPHAHGPPVASGDMGAYQIVIGLPMGKNIPAATMRDSIKSKCASYEKDLMATNWNRFQETDSGMTWLGVDQFLPQMRPMIDREPIKFEIMADIILARLDPVSTCSPLRVYEELTKWNSFQYQQDTKTSKNRRELSAKETGKLLSRLRTRIDLMRKQPIDFPILLGLVDKDIGGTKADQEAFRIMSRIVTNDDAASLRAADGDLETFIKNRSPCAQRYQIEVEKLPSDVADALQDWFKRLLKANEDFKRNVPATDAA
ncbi:hypothetical protein EV361DRAFT_879962 [Lentinula raphanica]|uniref:Uncharacterized protein n=1 Tax=Lentinula raphanica TaxID=153919 RepID=A0AA38UG20_9AGAR|nr:hypothetical protein F5878DRAFT_724219 [Lentinula raphanica]KAJ3977135.1 hypothetical protein EV361DRAFT_879962 [Lentinula raphanica]